MKHLLPVFGFTLLLALACSFGGVASNPAATPTAVMQEMTQPATATSAPTADLSDCAGDDPMSVIGGTPMPGVVSHMLYRATSTDGHVFTGDNVVLIQSASVPDAVLGPDGTIWVYFVNGEPGRHGIFIAQGSVNGPFEVIGCVKLDGQFEPTAVDPDIVRLSDGRYRLFYYANLGQTGGQNTIRSAVSDDGINFRVEGDVASGPYTDPSAAILPDGRWLLSIPRGQEGNLVFTSADGTTFDTTGVMVEGANGTPELAVLPDGRVRMYAGGNALGSFISSDGGSTWAPEPETKLTVPGAQHGGGLASVVQLADGTWLLFYVNAGQVGQASPASTPTTGGQLQFNPFANLTAEQESCLKAAWGEQAFQEITGFKRPPSPEEMQAMATCNLPTPSGPTGGESGGPTPPGPTGGESGGPARDQVYVATSTDGLTWTEGVLLAEKASVPEVIYTSKGEYWAYWVDFSAVSGPGTEKLGVARSADGAHWEMMGNAQIAGLGSIVPVDPDVMELPDGRLRLYFYDIAGPQGQNTIYSAVSSDGVNFTLEPGARFTLSGVFDPNVIVLPDGRYRMYLNMQDIVSATSSDGLTFTQDDGVRVEKGSVPGAIVLADGSVRLYACVQGISVYKSADGLNFTLEKKGVVPFSGGIICDPSVTATPDGFLMVYKYNPGK